KTSSASTSDWPRLARQLLSPIGGGRSRRSYRPSTRGGKPLLSAASARAGSPRRGSRFSRCRRATPSLDTRWGNYSPISTGIGKIGDLHRQFGAARRLVRRASVATRDAVGRGSLLQQIASL